MSYYRETSTGKTYYLNKGGEGLVKLTKAEHEKAMRQNACSELRELLKPGSIVYTTVRHVSASGMSRRITCAIGSANDGGKGFGVRNIDWLVARATGNKVHVNGGIVMGGCGMDMGFALVYSLGSALWPEGTPEPHGMRNGQPDTAGGYALRQEWL